MAHNNTPQLPSWDSNNQMMYHTTNIRQLLVLYIPHSHCFAVFIVILALSAQTYQYNVILIMQETRQHSELEKTTDIINTSNSLQLHTITNDTRTTSTFGFITRAPQTFIEVTSNSNLHTSHYLNANPTLHKNLR